MSNRIRKRLQKIKRRLERRLEGSRGDLGRPQFSAQPIRVELADKVQAIGVGGIGLMHQLAHRVGLVEAIDRRVHVLKDHRPYHESDHVLNLAYNALCDGVRLEDIELRRNDEVFLDALGAERIPDPTTAGDFCRRFQEKDIGDLIGAVDEARLHVWSGQPSAFFTRATIDLDGTLVATTGECKQGMDISYKGTWGYHPLVVSLAETGEVLRLVNRPGNRPSQEGAAAEADAAIALCRRAGFGTIVLRGNQENLIEQLKNGVQAMRMPVDNLVSNWAYMVMASLAWTLKAWFALLLPTRGRWADKHAAEKQSVLTLEFKRFRQAFIELPCQLVKTGRRIVYRLLSWNRWLPVFFRGVQALRCGFR